MLLFWGVIDLPWHGWLVAVYLTNICSGPWEFLIFSAALLGSLLRIITLSGTITRLCFVFSSFLFFLPLNLTSRWENRKRRNSRRICGSDVSSAALTVR